MWRGDEFVRVLSGRKSGIKIYDTSAESFSSILCLMDYSEKEMLVGTDNGVYLFDRERKTFRRGDFRLVYGL